MPSTVATGRRAALTAATVTPWSAATVTWEDGQVHPVVDVDVSSASHPYYTGRSRVLDTAGRVEKFQRRYGTAAR